MNIIKWTARIIGFAACTLFLIFFIQEGIPDIKEGKANDLIPFLFLFVLTVVGYIAAWFSHFWGGLALLSGGIGMWGYQLAFNHAGRFAIVLGLPFAIAGFLFLIYWHQKEFNSTKKYF